MPEGDILLRVARRLDAAFAGRRLTRGELRWGDLGGVDLAGCLVTENATYGKHLLTRLEDGRTMHTHLRMEGTWRLVRTAELRAGRTRADRAPQVRVVLATPSWTALGRDLGMVDLVATAEEHRVIGHLGPDVLAEDLDVADAAARILAQRDRPVAEVLLDQTVVAGLGTIYTAETLWAHRTWPWTPASALGGLAPELVRTARHLMLRSARARTPTATGDLRRTSNVHGREHRPCPRCGTPVERGTAASGTRERQMFFCPACQPPG
ncbi:DNA-formamidopyrimidine glycosylase family protein [Georgenia alba]|uniref:DNA-(apurinic or apyrimidinic site) lyase n=1 Tax=Georgenia alba TaxID=2233858 RepID=A0ABW2Q7C3_9MICO